MHTQFKDEKHVLVCQEHKTAEVYGDVGKYLSPGSVMAMETYDSAFKGKHPRTSDLFFQPCSGQHVSISYYLRAFGKSNFPGLPPPNSNLLRKQFTSVTDRHAKQNKCYEILKAYDKHGIATMKKSYICASAEQDAEYGQHIFKEVYGDPVPWPTAEDIADMTRKVIFDMIAAEEEQDANDEKEDQEFADEIAEHAGLGDEVLYWITPSEAEDIGNDTSLPSASSNQPVDVRAEEDVPTVEMEVDSAGEKPQALAAVTEGRGRTKGFGKGKTPEQTAHYAFYDPPEAGLGTKHQVTGKAHEWMEAQLKAWQDENAAGQCEKPKPTQWYWDKRIACIDAGLLETSHSWDVVRSWLKTIAKPQELGWSLWQLFFSIWILGLECGFWMLDSGFWILDSGFCNLDLVCWILDLGIWILDSGFWILGSGLWNVESVFWNLASGFWILDAVFWILESGFWFLDSGVWSLQSGVWILDPRI